MAYNNSEFSTKASQGSYLSYGLATEEVPELTEISISDSTINAYNNTTVLRGYSGVVRILDGYYIIESINDIGTNIKVPVTEDGNTDDDDMFNYLLIFSINHRLSHGLSCAALKSWLFGIIYSYVKNGYLTNEDVVREIDPENATGITQEIRDYLDSDSCPYYESIQSILYITMHNYFVTSGLLGLWAMNLETDLYSKVVLEPSDE